MCSSSRVVTVPHSSRSRYVERQLGQMMKYCCVSSKDDLTIHMLAKYLGHRGMLTVCEKYGITPAKSVMIRHNRQLQVDLDSKGKAVVLSCPKGCGYTRLKAQHIFERIKTPQFCCGNDCFQSIKHPRRNWLEQKVECHQGRNGVWKVPIEYRKLDGIVEYCSLM